MRAKMLFKVKEEMALSARERRPSWNRGRRPRRAGKCGPFRPLGAEARSHRPGRRLRERRLPSPGRKATPWEPRGTCAGPREPRRHSLGEGRAQAPGEGAPS